MTSKPAGVYFFASGNVEENWREAEAPSIKMVGRDGAVNAKMDGRKEGWRDWWI